MARRKAIKVSSLVRATRRAILARSQYPTGGVFLARLAAKKDAVTAESCRLLVETILELGLTDSHCSARAAAVVATTRLFKYFDTIQLNKVLVEAAADESAEVRRAAGILELELARKRCEVEV